MTEQVIRHRGSMRDDDDKVVAATDVVLGGAYVSPGGSTRSTDRSRSDGLRIAYTLYFTRPVDLIDDDQVTVRGERYRIVVSGWCMGGFDGREVLCVRGEG